MTRPALVVAFYANPDRYPPTYHAALELQRDFRVRIVCRANAEAPCVTWPADLRVDRVGPAIPDREKDVQPALLRLREYLSFSRALRRAIAEEKPALVLAYEPHALVATFLAGRHRGVVYQRHEIEDPEPLNPKSLQSWVRHTALRLSRHTDLVVFPEARRAALHQRLTHDARPPLIVPNYPRRETFPQPANWPSLLRRRRETRQLLYRGALGPDNGITQMIRCLPDIAPDLTLRLCGTVRPAFAEELTALADSLGVRARVQLSGFIPSYEQLNRETPEALVGFVLRQPVKTNLIFNATATNKLYEYAACGVPTVVPDNPAYREALAGESWVAFADPTDPRSVAAAVTRLLDDEDAYDARSRAARAAFDARFHFESGFAPLRDALLRLARRD